MKKRILISTVVILITLYFYEPVKFLIVNFDKISKCKYARDLKYYDRGDENITGETLDKDLSECFNNRTGF